MLVRLLHALIQSKNEAADDVLVEALRLGSENEQRAALEALLRRKTVRGLSGIISAYARLPESLQLHVLRNVKTLHHSREELSKAATEAMVALARWVAVETRRLQKGVTQHGGEGVSESDHSDT